jgi:hypothetical protein
MRPADREHWKIISLSGHRNVSLKDESRIVAATKTLVNNPTIDAMYFGGALGADTISLRAAATYRVGKRPHLVVVCPNTRNHQPVDARKYFHLADEVIELGYEITRDDGFKAFKLRNEYLVDVASSLVAFYSGKRNSGTGHAVGYAESLGLSVYKIPVELA